MTSIDFITELFCRIDDAMQDVPKHPQARLAPSEIVTLGLLFALKGRGNRAFYRWVTQDLITLFPHLPERTRLFRLFSVHSDWTDRFLSEPTLLGVADSYGIELIHPRRQGRSDQQIGEKGKSNQRWIVGAKLAVVLNRFGLVCDWTLDTANVYDTIFHPMIARFDGQMLILADSGFHAKQTETTCDPPNLKICAKRTWNVRIIVETVLSMLTRVCLIKKVGHRSWEGLRAHLAYALAVFNICVQWNGLQPDQYGAIPISMAEFAL